MASAAAAAATAAHRPGATPGRPRPRDGGGRGRMSTLRGTRSGGRSASERKNRGEPFSLYTPPTLSLSRKPFCLLFFFSRSLSSFPLSSSPPATRRPLFSTSPDGGCQPIQEAHGHTSSREVRGSRRGAEGEKRESCRALARSHRLVPLLACRGRGLVSPCPARNCHMLARLGCLSVSTAPGGAEEGRREPLRAAYGRGPGRRGSRLGQRPATAAAPSLFLPGLPCSPLAAPLLPLQPTLLGCKARNLSLGTGFGIAWSLLALVCAVTSLSLSPSLPLSPSQARILLLSTTPTPLRTPAPHHAGLRVRQLAGRPAGHARRVGRPAGERGKEKERTNQFSARARSCLPHARERCLFLLARGTALG